MQTNPNPSQLDEQLQALVAEALQVDPQAVTPELAFGDLPEWDSLGHMEIMLRLEEQYGVAIDADAIAELVSLPAIRDRIRQQEAHS